MSNKVLEKFDEISEAKKLSINEKLKIRKDIFENLVVATDIIALFTILIVASLFLSKQTLIIIYNASSLVMLAFTIFIWEIAYKKENGTLAIYGIEMLIFSLAILFMPYSLLKLHAFPLKIINIFTVTYYIIKSIIIYNKEKTKILTENSDIKEIVKKESKDAKVEANLQDMAEKMLKNKKTKKENSSKKDKQEENKSPKTKKKTTTKTNKKQVEKKKTTTKSTEIRKTTTKKSTKKSADNEKINKSEIKTKKTPKKQKNAETAKTEEIVTTKRRGRPRKETNK